MLHPWVFYVCTMKLHERHCSLECCMLALVKLEHFSSHKWMDIPWAWGSGIFNAPQFNKTKWIIQALHCNYVANLVYTLVSSKGLFTPWTMNLFKSPVKLCGWLLNSFRDPRSLHEGKNVRVTEEFEVLEKTYFKAYIIYWHGPPVLQWERQKGCSCRKGQGSIAQKYCYNKNNPLLGKRRWREEKKNDQTWFFNFLFQMLLDIC